MALTGRTGVPVSVYGAPVLWILCPRIEAKEGEDENRIVNGDPWTPDFLMSWGKLLAVSERSALLVSLLGCSYSASPPNTSAYIAPLL